MKIKSTQTLSLLMLFIFSIDCSILTAQTDSAYFYLDGVKEKFYQQPDVYSFRLSDKSEFTTTLPANLIEKQEYSKDGMNYIYFKNTASASNIQSTISSIVSSPLFEKEFMVLTKNWLSNFDSKDFIPTNDIIEIVFNNEDITITEVNTFATNNFLELIHTPVKGGVYLFRVAPIPELVSNSSKLTLERASEVWEQNMALIDKVAPSLGLFQRTSTSDTLYDKMWHVENNGITTYGTQGYVGASAKINTVWNLNDEFGTYQGYTGAGVTVAVIDYDGFQYTHPDMQGVYLPGQYISTDTTYEFNTDIFLNTNLGVHGLAVSSIIAANADNTFGMAGVAYDAKIKPILLPDLTIAFTDVLNMALDFCLQDASDLNNPNTIDVINMSFGREFAGAIINATHLPLTQTIEKVYSFNNKGIPMIASAGNGNGYNQIIPALYTEVLSVGASTPKDRRKIAHFNPNGFGIDFSRTADGFDFFAIDSVSGDTTFNSWGSSYFIDMDVVAPGSSIPALSIYYPGASGTITYDGFEGFALPSLNINFTGSSAAAPIVSGIVALLLEKEPNLTAEQIYNAVRNGAEKTGGYVYSDTMAIVGVNTSTGAPQTYYYYTANPKHVEMGYGRVNAYNTVFNTDTTLNYHLEPDDDITSISHLQDEFNFYFNNPTNDNLKIQLNKKANYQISVLNLNGKLISNHTISNDNKITIPVSDLSNGLYFITIQNSKTNHFANSKFIKQ